LANLQGPQRENLSETQIAELPDQYYRSLLDEDDETRLDGFVEIGLGDDGVKSYLGPLVEAPRRTFEEHEEANADSEVQPAMFMLVASQTRSFWTKRLTC
jgi:hypothetical protein